MPDGRMATNGAVHRARIFTVPPGQPFLVALARAILAGDLPVPGGAAPDPLSLPSYTLLLPTRRAARALHDAFLKVGGGRALLLPRIRPIAEGQEDLGLLESAAEQVFLADHVDDLPPAITELERRLALTRLVMAWAEAQRRAHTGEGRLQPFAGAGARTPAQAARLSTDLARLMDTVETENASLAGLEDLVPETLSEHWQTTLEFSKIVTEAWPAYLKERGLSSPMERRNRLVLAEAARLAARPPAGPVIVAGVTGSVPATAELMRAVSRLPQGAIILPALDQSLDTETWAISDRWRSRPSSAWFAHASRSTWTQPRARDAAARLQFAAATCTAQSRCNPSHAPGRDHGAVAHIRKHSGQGGSI